MIFLVYYVVVCIVVALAGVRRPFGFWGYLVTSLLFTPVVGLLLVAAAGENRARRRGR